MPYTLQQLQQMGAKPIQEKEIISEQKKKRSAFGKVAEFIAPTATRAVGKLRKGEKLTKRDIIGGALEVGSFFIPVGAAARGLGLAGKGALTLGRRIALGAGAGAVAGGTFEAGRTIGQEGTSAIDVLEATGKGAAFGGVGGGIIPAAVPAVRAGIVGARAIPQITQKAIRGTDVAYKNITKGGRAAKEIISESVIKTGRKIPEKIGQFAEEKARYQARLKGQPHHIQEAVRKNIQAPVIDFIKKANPQDKAIRVKMLNIAKKGTENLSFRGQAKQIPGKVIVEGPVAHLIKTKDIAVNQTKNILKKLGTKAQNQRKIFDEFLGDMAEKGVTSVNRRLRTVRGSRIPQSDLKFYQEVFNDLRPNKGGKSMLTYNQLHRLRQKWFEVAKADKTFTSGPTGYAGHLRSLLAKPIDKASKGAYINSQNKTRESLEGIKEFVKLIGYKGRLDDITTKDLKAGEVFLRSFGNAADRPLSVLDQIYSIAKKYGYKGTENIYDQLRFADILDDIYGSPTRSLRGQVGRGVADSQDPLSRGLSAAREAVKWSPVSAALRLTRGFLSGTGEDTLRAFENLIRVEGGQKLPSVFGAKAKSISEIVEKSKEAIKKTNLGK